MNNASNTLMNRVFDQRRWIERCEQNPKSSYYNPDRPGVRQADLDALHHHEREAGLEK